MNYSFNKLVMTCVGVCIILLATAISVAIIALGINLTIKLLW